MCQDKRKIIAYLWYVIALISVIYVAAAIAAAARNNEATTASEAAMSAAGFAAIWSMLVLCIILVGGTLTMKRFKTPIATGMFLGACLMFSQMELLLFAIFIGLAKKASGAEAQADNFFASFSFFLAVLYAVFSGFLFTFRHFVIEDTAAKEQTADNFA